MTVLKRVRVKPVSRLFLAIHNFMLPLIEGEHSNMMVATFQRVCGLQTDKTVTNFFLNYLFRIASTTGEEIFGLMPLMFWLTFPLSLSFATNFVTLLIIGQLLKDFMMLPRPVASDPKWKIVKLDEHFETEFGLPSTHTMTGYLPMTITMALERQGFIVPQSAWVCTIVYVIVVALSRLYLGVHSVYDIVAGAVLGLAVIQLTHAYGDAAERVVYMSSTGIWVSLALLLAFVTIYPKPAKGWAASYGTSAQIFGTWFGCSSALWYVFNVHTSLRDTLILVSQVPCSADMYTAASTAGDVLSNSIRNSSSSVLVSTTVYSPAVALALRLLVSGVAAALVKVLSKIVAVKLFVLLIKTGVTRVEPEEERDVFGRKVDLTKAYWVEVPVRLINYGGLAWATIVLSPLLWQYLGLV